MGSSEPGEGPRWRWQHEAPEGVVVYANSHAFIAENPERENRAWEIPGDLAGWDVADGFRLDEAYDVLIPEGYRSEWRISILDDGEVYAVRRKDPGRDVFTFEGPVWLIDTVPDGLSPSISYKPLRRITDAIESLRGEPDSLLLAAHYVRAAFQAVRDEGGGGGQERTAAGS